MRETISLVCNKFITLIFCSTFICFVKCQQKQHINVDVSACWVERAFLYFLGSFGFCSTDLFCMVRFFKDLKGELLFLINN